MSATWIDDITAGVRGKIWGDYRVIQNQVGDEWPWQALLWPEGGCIEWGARYRTLGEAMAACEAHAALTEILGPSPAKPPA